MGEREHLARDRLRWLDACHVVEKDDDDWRQAANRA
jgi:hypothetical protein